MPGWSPAQKLPSHWLLPSAGIDGSGRVRIAYLELLSTDPISTRVAIAEWENGAWVDVFEKESTAGDIPIEVTLAAGVDGSAAACFTSVTTADPATYTWRHHVTYAPAATRTWETPVEIVPASAASQFTRQRRVKVADDGTAVVIADRFDGPGLSANGSVVITFHPSNAPWTAPRTLLPQGGLYGSAVLGVDGAGTATVAWVHRYQASPAKSSIRVCTVTADGPTPTAAPLTPENGTHAGAVCLDVNALGAAVLGAQVGSHANVTTRPSISAPWEPWGALFTSSTAATSSCQDVGVALSGMAFAQLRRQGPTSSGNDAICAARRGSYGSWSTPAPVSPLGTMSFDGKMTIRKGAFGSHEAVFVYASAIGYGGGEPGLGVFQACHWPDYLHDPPPSVDIAEQGPRHGIDQVVHDHPGGVLVLETVREGFTARSYATAYDVAAPDIVETVVPTTVAVDQPVQVRNKLVDIWSPMGAIRWDFGDGTPPGVGATVTHSWAAPGPYTVTLTGADARGNTVTQAFTVTAGP